MACLLNPITGVRSGVARVIAHLFWAGWCACAVRVCVMYGAKNDFWGPLQWEWPGFWLQSAGYWVSAAGHAGAALWHPVQAEPGAAPDPARMSAFRDV